MKLVRDKIPELYPDGFGYHKATPTERLLLLHLKLAEETGEVLSAPAGDQFLTELGDLLDVADALREARGWTVEDLEAARKAKAARLGGFDEGWVLE